MSEYQYYEFLAVDRMLTPEEMRELREVSTRAEITRTRFVNEYSWGNFKGDPVAWVERYFDVFLYLANWGTHELLFRLPPGSLDLATARRYCPGDPAKVREAAGQVILSFSSQEEGGEDWVEAEGLLASIVGVRAEIASGDHRALYLAWLLCVAYGEVDDEAPEPPVPPGLGDLTPAQQAFADFLRIDPDLIAAAAERSPGSSDGDDPAALRAWISALPSGEATDLLARVAAGEEGRVRAELLRRFRGARDGGAGAAPEPRTAAELLEAAERSEAERIRRAREEAARERERLARRAAADRERRLAELADREEAEWERADALVSEKQAAAYDEAVRLLTDLRELAARAGRADEASARMAELRARHSSKWSFVKRLDVAIS